MSEQQGHTKSPLIAECILQAIRPICEKETAALNGLNYAAIFTRQVFVDGEWRHLPIAMLPISCEQARELGAHVQYSFKVTIERIVVPVPTEGVQSDG